MRIAFVHLGREHLGIEYLSAALRERGHAVELHLDLGLFGINDNVFYFPRLESRFSQSDHILNNLSRLRPDLLAFSVYSSNYRWSLEMARRLKQEFGVPTVFGGIHVTSAPEEVIRHPQVDYVVVGEGEAPLQELADHLEQGRSPAKIANLWLKENGRLIKNPVRPPLDLDSLPFPDKALFEPYVNYRDDYMTVATRGCLFRCSYCCEGLYQDLYAQRYFRRRSPQRMLAELKTMQARYRFRELIFYDTIFINDKKWLREFLPAYKTEIGVPFKCMGHIRFFDREVGKLLRDAGCYCINFGLQTFNEKVKAEKLHRHESTQESLEVFHICDDIGLYYDIDHIFGLPGEEEADFVQAAKYYSRMKFLNRVKCFNLTFFPGTAMEKIAIQERLITQEDATRAQEGDLGDYFHKISIRNRRSLAWQKQYMNLFKIIPLIPPAAIDIMERRRLFSRLASVPVPLTLLGQLLIAFRNRDLRFLIYIKYYFRSIYQLLLKERLKPYAGSGGCIGPNV